MLRRRAIVAAIGVAASAIQLSCAVHASDFCVAKMSVRKNGSVVIDKEVFWDAIALKARIAEFRTQNPHCSVGLVSERGTEIKTVEHVAKVLSELGISKVGFLIEPNSR